MKAEFNFNKLREKINLVNFPENRDWGTLTVKKFPYIAFMDLENGINKRKVIIRKNLHVDVYLKQKACPWIKVKKPKSIDDINQILKIINKNKV